LNQNRKKKAVLIEIGGSHTECLYSQILFLKNADFKVNIICSTNLKSKILDFNTYLSVHDYSFGINQGNDWKNLIELKRYLINNRYDKVIFNTSSGNLIRNLLTFHFPKDLEFIGVIHDINKLTQSFTQKLINRKIKKYFVLNDYILDTFLSKDRLSVESFYPIFHQNINKTPLSKPNGEFWICIPGSVEYERRDYLGLLKNLENENINDNIKFILLGTSKHFNSDAEDVKKRVHKLKIREHFLFFDNYIPDNEYQVFIEKSDVIMPLIHESHPMFKEINGFKISGSFNLAFAHKKPILCEESLNKFEDFKENGVFYTLESMVKVINDISSNIQKLEDLKQPMYKNPKWSFEFQKNKYISFLEKIV
jgi:hypothetical protein